MASPLLSPPPSHPSSRAAAARRSRSSSNVTSSGLESPLYESKAEDCQISLANPFDSPASTPAFETDSNVTLTPKDLQLEQTENDVSVGDDIDTIPLPDNPSEDASIQEILQQLEDIDLATFLARQTREFSEARTQDPSLLETRLQAPQWQIPSDKQPWEQSERLRQIEECLRWLAKRLPRDMVTDYDAEDADPARFSLSRTRAGAERLYMLIPPSKVNSFRSHARDLAYWRKPRQSAVLLLVYLLALYNDLCPALFLTAIILAIIKRRVLPPDATALRDEVVERRKLAKEAKQIGADFETRGQLTTLGSFLASTSNAASQGAKGQPSTTDRLASTKKGANSHSKRNTITLAREIGANFGPDAQRIMEDAANMGEKLRNLALFRDPTASWRILAAWSLIAFSLFFIPPEVYPRAVFAWIGMHFFCFAYLRHRFPRYRRVSPFHLNRASKLFSDLDFSFLIHCTGLYWVCQLMLLQRDSSCNAEQRRESLSKRFETSSTQKSESLDKKNSRCPSLTRRSVEATISKSSALPCSVKARSVLAKPKMCGFISQARAQITSMNLFCLVLQVLNSYSFDKDTDHALGTSFFCFQGRTPGRIVLENEHLRFDGVKGVL